MLFPGAKPTMAALKVAFHLWMGLGFGLSNGGSVISNWQALNKCQQWSQFVFHEYYMARCGGVWLPALLLARLLYWVKLT